MIKILSKEAYDLLEWRIKNVKELCRHSRTNDNDLTNKVKALEARVASLSFAQQKTRQELASLKRLLLKKGIEKIEGEAK